MKKDAKKEKPYTEGKVATLLEDISSKFNVLYDGQKTLDRRIEGIEVNQAATLERVTALEINVRKIQAGIVEIKTDFAKRLTHLEALK